MSTSVVEDGVAKQLEHGEVDEEPSREWGWHGGFPVAGPIVGWIVVAALLLMTIGNHTGKVEDIWLVGVAVVLAFAMIRDMVRRRSRA